MIPWSRKWQPTPVFLPGESHGQGSLVGSNPWGGHRKSDMTTHACHHLFLKNSLLSEIHCIWKSYSNPHTDHDMKSLQIPLPGLWGRVVPPHLRKSSPSLLLLLWFSFAIEDAAARCVGTGFHPCCCRDCCDGWWVSFGLSQLLTGHAISLTLGTKGENIGPTVCG